MKLQKKGGWIILIMLVAFVVLFTPHTTHAAGFCFSAKGCIQDLLTVFLNMFGLVLGFAGVFLNLVVKYTILDMKAFTDGLTGINIAWTVIRDLANILFVFILLFIGINTILGSWNQSSFSTKLIPKIILAALLINFSLFFTKVIIDVSNIVTNEFYKATASLGSPQMVGGKSVDMGIAGAFMDGLRMSAVGKGGVNNLPNYAIFRAFLSIIFILVAAFVFFTIAFMLIVRFVVLIFLMLTSPIAFLGGLLPQLKPHADKWWQQLSSQAMFGPIFMILALVVILIIRDPGFATFFKTATTTTTITGKAVETMGDLVKIILQYCIAMFLLVSALITAKQTAGKVGAGFTNWGEKLAKTATYGGALAITKSAAGAVARGTAGRGAEAFGKKYDSVMAKIPTATYNKFNKVTGGMAGALDRGARKKIEGVEKSKFGTTQSRGEIQAAERARAKKFSEVRQKDEAQAKIDDNAAHVQDVLKKGIAGSFDSEADKAIKGYLEGVGGLANDKVIEMFENDFDKLSKDKHLMAAITPKQLAAITDSKNDKLTDAEKKTFKDEHKTAVQQRIALAPDNYAEARKVASGKHVDVANMHKDLLTNHYVAAALSPNVLKEILENDKLDPTERATVKTHIETRVNDLNRKIATGATLTPGETKEAAALQKTIDWLYNPDIVKQW